jgi:hypothetical protein
MASLVVLLNKAITYIKESKSEVNEVSEVNEMSDTTSEVTTDDENSNKVATSTDNKWEYCGMCERFLKPQYYINDADLCQCCYEISLGQDKRCNSCGGFKHITLFRKPKLIYCEECVDDLSKLRQYCHSCDCTVQFKYWNKHVLTKKHLLRTYVEQLADEYQGEYDNCIVYRSTFQQSDLLRDHICVKCIIDNNIPKNHCDICNSDILITNWSKHLNSKQHFKMCDECCL